MNRVLKTAKREIPVGFAGGYRFGFNGQERTDEIKGIGNHNTALYWEYDTRLGRRWNLDPKRIIGISDYSVNSNNPIFYIDPLGDFRTKFGAQVHKFFHGGQVSKAGAGDAAHAGEYFVGKEINYEGEGAGIAFQRTFNSNLASVAEYGRGAISALGNFFSFVLGGGGNKSYGQGTFEADEMASSLGIQNGFRALRKELAKNNNSAEFGLDFSPNPKSVLKDIGGFNNPFGSSISTENVNAHLDAIGDQSWTKLYVGGYDKAKIIQIDANTVKIIINNSTTANSFFGHAGILLFGEENGAKQFNELWTYTPFFKPVHQRFEFTVPFKK